MAAHKIPEDLRKANAYWNSVDGGNPLTWSGAQTFSGAVTMSSTLALTGAITQAAKPITTLNVGTAATGLTAVENGDGCLHQTTLTAAALSLSVVGDEAGVGQYTGLKIYDFPVGLILVLGATINGTMTTASPCIATWDGDIGLGTAVPTDHASGVNGAGTAILDSTATTQASSNIANCDAVSAATALTESGARHLDGTSTAIDLCMNLLIDDSAAHNTTINPSFAGTVEITWILIGTTA